VTKNAGIVGRARTSLRGLRAAWRRERSFREHLALTLVGLAALALIGADWTEWLVAIVALAAALGLEAMNAAFEALADKLHPARDEAIGGAKDVASGAAFVANCAAGAIVAAILARNLLA